MNNKKNQNNAVKNNYQEMAANGLSLSEIRKVVTEQMHGYTSVDGMSVMKLVQLLGSAIAAKKEVYDLSFVKDAGTWYIDLPNWPWKRSNLAMVCGADKMLDLLAASPENDKGPNRVRLQVKPADKPMDEQQRSDLFAENWVELRQIDSTLTGGATYTAEGQPMKNFVSVDLLTNQVTPRTLWLCPVTLFVFGQYPKYFYGRVIK